MAKMKKTATGKNKLKNMSDTNLLLLITVIVFFLMYIGAIVFQGGGFLKPQTFFNILNANAALLIASLGMSIVMITGSIDISVGGVAALVSMCCAVYLDHMGGKRSRFTSDCGRHRTCIWTCPGLLGGLP